MPLKRLSLLMLVAALSSCGAGTTTDISKTTSTTRTTDAGVASTLPLRTSDLPAGFAAVDVRSTNAVPMISQCLQSLLVASGSAVGETFLQNRNSVSSQSYVLAATQTANDLLASLTDPAIQRCLTSQLQSFFDQSLSTAGLAGLLDVPSSAVVNALDPATTQIRVSAVRTTDTTTQTVATADLVISQTNRSISAIWLTWFYGSPSVENEKSLVTALRARATAAFSA